MSTAADRLLSRKYLVTVLVIVIGTGLQIAGKLDPVWVEFATWMVGLYITGNVVAPIPYRIGITPTEPPK